LTFKSAQAFVNWSLVHIFEYWALYPLLHCSDVGLLAAMAEVETASAKPIANAYRMFTLLVVSGATNNKEISGGSRRSSIANLPHALTRFGASSSVCGALK
jgi:hypothetical protein